VVLGERHARKPANVARLTVTETITFARKALAGVPELAEITKRVDHDTGRPRALSVEVFLAAAIAAAATDSMNMHVRGIAAVLRSLPVPEQRVLGVRWTDPNRGGEKLITERQVEYLFAQVAKAFDADLAQHDHLFIQGDDVWTPDGEWVCPADHVSAGELSEMQCASSCPHAQGMEHLGNRLLARVWEYTRMPNSDRWAVDSTVVETHFATKSHGPATDINPDFLPDTDKHLATVRKKKPPGGKAVKKSTKKTAQELFAAFVPPHADPRSRRPAPAGPRAPGGFTRFHPDFPRIAPDGRLLHTKDPGARNAFRGAGNSRSSEIVNGRDKHALVAAGMFPDGTPMPPLTRAYRATPGSDAKDSALLTLLQHAEDTNVTPGIFSADRIYSICKPETLQHPLTERGWTLVRDLKGDQRTSRQWTNGVLYLDGWWYPTGLPTGLFDLPRPPMNANATERRDHQARFDYRAAYAFRTNGTTSAGNLRLRGPAVPDRTIRDNTGTIIEVRGVRARCINSPYIHLLPRTIPATTCTKGQPCGCSKTITIKPDEIPNSCEPLLWGTTKWASEYHRRNLSEAAFSVEQHHYGLGRHSIRVRAHKWDLAFAIVNLATFIRQFHSLVMRLGAHALDPGYHSALDPDVFTLALERVLTPRFGKRTPSRGDPPDH
jgi:hypothetical protein